MFIVCFFGFVLEFVRSLALFPWFLTKCFFYEKLLFLVVCVFFEVWELLSGVSASV